MSLHLKPIPVAMQRRAAAFPCDGVKRFKVGKKRDLSYSEARAEILRASDLGQNDRGGRILKRGTAERLSDLNRHYFRLAGKFINKAIWEVQAAAAQAQSPVIATEVEGAPLKEVDVHQGQAQADHNAEDATVSTILDVANLLVGGKLVLNSKEQPAVGVLTRNKSGYRCVIDGQEARSRNEAKIKELITTALGEGWTTSAPEQK